MKVSELIAELEAVKAEHGDIEIEYSYNDAGYYLDGSSEIHQIEVEVAYHFDEETGKENTHKLAIIV